MTHVDMTQFHLKPVPRETSQPLEETLYLSQLSLSMASLRVQSLVLYFSFYARYSWKQLLAGTKSI